MTDENEVGERPKGPIPTVEKLLNFIQDSDARLGLALSVFLLLLITFVWFSSAYGGSFSSLVRAFGAFLLLSTGVVIFFKVIDGSILPRVIVWYFTSLLLLTVSVFWVQAILRTPAPFLVEARCFVDLWSQGCPLGTSVAQKVEVAPLFDATQQSDSAPDKRNRVYVQFAGALSREDIIKVSLKLKDEGWNVQGAERGGERTAQAVGIDQVRYFHNEDQDIAKRLTTKYNELASSWHGFDQLSVAFVAGNESRVPVGYLEVWTSVD
ncbi:MAG: hypothetical protein WC782_16570 [Methylococcaceae bacterium]|jgi:hypothetical protein